MPRRSRSTLTTALTAIALGAALAADAQAAGTSKVTGSVRAAWVEEGAPLADGRPSYRREVAVRWTPVAVVRKAADAYSWLRPQFIDRYADYAIEFDWGYVLRANVALERFTETSRQECRDGTIAELTTRVGMLARSRVLLKTSGTLLDLPRRRGTLNVRLPNAHISDGRPLVNDFLAPGLARLAYTGAICSESGGPVTPAPGDLLAEQDLDTVLGAEALNAVVQANADLPLTVARGGALTLSVTRPRDVPDFGEGRRLSGSFGANLRITGPPRDRSARCTIPAASAVRRARSLSAMLGLLRRHGFPSAPLGRPRSARVGERGARFAINAPAGASAQCGAALGSRRAPVLVPLRG